MHFFSPCPQLVPPRSRRHNILCRHTPRLVQNDQSKRLSPFAEPFAGGTTQGSAPHPARFFEKKLGKKLPAGSFKKSPHPQTLWKTHFSHFVYENLVGTGGPVAVPSICLRRQASSPSADRCHSLKSLLPLRGAPIAPLDGPPQRTRESEPPSEREGAKVE